MWEHAGPFRSGEGLERAAVAIRDLREQLPDLTISEDDVFNLDVQDYYELKAMLRSAEAVVVSALQRVESRGAHQRLDAPQMSPAFERNQLVFLDGSTGPKTPLRSRWRSVVRSEVRSA
jgi:succinate dehydrogenase/fumarate reductase flavoprotein subunit